MMVFRIHFKTFNQFFWFLWNSVIQCYSLMLLSLHIEYSIYLFFTVFFSRCLPSTQRRSREKGEYESTGNEVFFIYIRSYKCKGCKWEQVLITNVHVEKVHVTTYANNMSYVYGTWRLFLCLLCFFSQECAGEEDVQAVRWRSVSVTSETDQRRDTQER